MRKAIVAAVVIVAVVLAASALVTLMPKTQKQTPELERVFKAVFINEITTFDPAKFTLAHEYAAISNIYSTLVGYKPGTTEMVPDLAERWETSADGLVYTFYLRKDVKWQKGFGDLTSEDVKLSINRVMSNATKSPYRSNYAVVDHVEVVDKYTVRVFLNAPDPAFLYKLAPFRQGPIVSQAAVQKFGDQYGKTPESTVGSGPFMLTEWIPKERIVLTRNPDYYGQKPWLDKVIYLLIEDETTRVLSLQKGEVDAISVYTPASVQTTQKDANLYVLQKPTTGIQGIMINLQDPILKDVRVRQAISYAIDRKAVVNDYFNGMAREAYGYLSPSYVGSASRNELPDYSYDPVKAKQLLVDAGYPQGFKTLLATYNVKPWVDLAPIYQAMLAKVGIQVEVKTLPIPQLTDDIYNARNPMVILALGARPIEPSVVLMTTLHSSASKPGLNAALYTGIDSLLAKALAAPNDGARLATYKEIQIKIMTDLPVVSVYWPIQNVVARSYVKGLTLDVFDPIGDWLENVYFEPWPLKTTTLIDHHFLTASALVKDSYASAFEVPVGWMKVAYLYPWLT